MGVFGKRLVAGLMVVIVVATTLTRMYMRGFFQFGPTNIEVIETYRPEFEIIRGRLERAAHRLVETPIVAKPMVIEEISPPLTYRVDDLEQTNVVLIEATLFAKPPDSEIEFSDSFTFSFLSDPFFYEPILAWTSDNNPLASHLWDRDGSGIEKKMKLALQNVEYVMLGYIDRRVDFQQPQPLQGQVDIVRVRTGELVAQVPFEGPPPTPLREYPWEELGKSAIEQVKKALGKRFQSGKPDSYSPAHDR